MTADVRQRIVDEAVWGNVHRAEIHYAEIRPIPLTAYRDHHLPLTTDCSGFATACYYAAGAPDPNANGYDGEGYTGTLLGHLPAIPQSDAQPGDLIVFGAYPGKHVVVIVGTGIGRSNPSVVSHGTEAGPTLTTYNAIRLGFPGDVVTWLQGVPPAPKRVAVWVFRDIHGNVVKQTRHPGGWGFHRLRRHNYLTMQKIEVEEKP